MIRLVGLFLGCVLLLLPMTLLAGFIVAGGGKVTVTEGNPGSLSYDLTNTGKNDLKVFVAPEKGDFILDKARLKGDATDIPTLTKVSGMAKGTILAPGETKSFKISFITDQDGQEKDKDFGLVPVDVSGEIFAVRLRDVKTGETFELDHRNFPASSIQVNDAGFANPEPSTLTLLGLGSLGLLGYGWRRWRRAEA
jgi:hypothetical protein